MAAVDIQEIYRFEEAFESASLTFLADATGLDVYRSNMTTDFTTPRIEVEFECGEAFDPPAPRNGGASPTAIDYIAFNATFTILITTDNSVGESGEMSNYVGEVRAAMARSAPNWQPTETTLTGTAIVVSAATIVTGSGTLFTTELFPGSLLSIDGSPNFTVATITDAVTLNLAAGASAGYSGAVTTAGLPYYDLKDLRPSSTTLSIDGDMNEVTMSYALVFEIRQDAWPA